MEPHTRKKTLLGGAAVVALLAVGLLATQAVGAFGGFGHGAPGHSGMAMCQRQNLTESSGDVTDGCMSFHADAATGTLTGYTLKVNGSDVKLLDSLTVPALAGGQEELRRGYVLHEGNVALVALGPQLRVMARNGTAATFAFPAAATVTVHQAVADWSPAGATIDYGTVKATLLLPPGATITQSGNSVSVQTVHGPIQFHLGPNGPGPMGMHGPHPGFGGGFAGRGPGPRDGPRDDGFGPRDGPRGPPPE